MSPAKVPAPIRVKENEAPSGDVLIVWKLDRLSRSLADFLRILEKIDKAGATFKSLTEALDTTGTCGRLMMNMLGTFNQFERDLIKERTKLGLNRARKEGRIGAAGLSSMPGARPKPFAWVRSGEKTQTEVAELFGVSKATVSRMMDRVNAKDL